MPYILDGRRLRVGRPFIHPDGRQFGGNWNKYTTDELKRIGITYEADPAPVDYLYYFSAGNPRPFADVPQVYEDGKPVLDDAGNQVIQQGLKTDFTKTQKTTAGRLLSSTDWYVVRKAETDAAIPSDVATYRAAVRTVCATREAEIAAVSTTEALEALIKAPDKITNDAGEIVDNPAAHLTPWPVLAE